MVTLYSSDTCVKCKLLKRELDSRHIKYKESHDYEVLEDYGLQTLPVLMVDGFNPYTFDDAIKNMKYLEVVYGQSAQQ